jgi:hypothetical protein
MNLLPEGLRNLKNKPRKRLSIAIACDFFVPNLGGVEMHIYNVA